MFYEKMYSETDRDYFSYLGNGLVYPTHLHRSFEFFRVNQGSANVTVRGEKKSISAGQGVLIFPNQPHSYDDYKDCQHEICIFSPNLVNRFYIDKKGLLPQSVVIDCSKIGPPPPPDNLYSVKSYLYGIVGEICNQTEFAVKGKSDNAIDNILSYLSEHYKDNCTLSEMADILGYDYSYVSRLFSRTLGMGFCEYLYRLRIGEAERLIKDTDMNFTDIAFACGFNSLRSFNRAFLSVCNMSPSKFKKENQIIP